MEGLNRTKRIFILLVIFGILFTYFIYDSNWRNGHLVPNSRRRDSRFPERILNLPTTASSSLARQITTTTFTDIHEAANGAPNKRRIKETETTSSSGYVPTSSDNDFESFERRSNSNSDRSEGVDRTDKPGSLDLQDDFINELDTHNGQNNALVQKSSNNGTGAALTKERRLPNVIIIGVKKGGTRALLEILKIHPDIEACNTEVHFFDREHNYKKGLEWYRAQMPYSLHHEITLEKSPAYFVTRSVPERVKRMSKTVKLLVVVRDPTRRAISDYTQSMVKKPFIASFESFAIADIKRGKVKEKWRKLQIGWYDEHLSRWLEHFPIEQLHFVSGEELIKSPAAEIQLVEKFLNLKPYIRSENFYFNETKGFYCLIGKNSRGGRQSKPNCMGKTKGRIHPAVNGEVLKILHNHYRPHNLKFYKMVNRDFGWP